MGPQPHALNALFDNVQRLEEGPTRVVFSAIHKRCRIDDSAAQRPSSGIHLCPSSVGKSLGPEGLKETHPTFQFTTMQRMHFKTLASKPAHLAAMFWSRALFLVADILHHPTGDRRDPGVVS